MCGIAGWMGCSLEEGACHDLLDGLAHRRPDGLGQRRWPRAGLLHTRLIYRGVRAVEPGQRVALDCRRDVVTRHTALFHRWELAPDPHLTLDEARDRVDGS
jgi:hypothetical protein